MKFGMLAFAVGMMASNVAFAFPPTATTSPGYDRALAESRKARQIQPPPMFVEPAPSRQKLLKKHKR